MAKISMIVNGNQVSGNVDPRTLLVQFLRENLQLTGTHVGCDTSYCGACTLQLDGRAVKSCTLFAVQVDGCKITTVEGLAIDRGLSPLQQAFLDKGAVQCGFCIPGQLVSAHALLADNPHPTVPEIQEGLAGNLCRCGCYQQITDAVLATVEGAGR